MKLTVILIVIGAPGTISKGLVRGLEESEIEGWAETIQTTTISRSVRILRSVLKIWGDLLSLKTPVKDHQLKLMGKTFVSSIFALVWMVLTVLFYATFKRDSVSFLRFPFLHHVQVFLYAISPVRRLKYPYGCFSSYFCFLVFVVLYHSQIQIREMDIFIPVRKKVHNFRNIYA